MVEAIEVLIIADVPTGEVEASSTAVKTIKRPARDSMGTTTNGISQEKSRPDAA